MRHIGIVSSQEDATRFSDYLLSVGVRAHIEPEDGQAASEWAVWVQDEDQVKAARAALEEFLAQPDDARYLEASKEASRLREEDHRRRIESAKNIRHVRQDVWGRPATQRIPVTLAVVLVCVVIGMITQLGGVTLSTEPDQPDFGARVFSALRFQSLTATGDGWASIRDGQLWRLFTPALLHGSLLHIVFNMMCLIVFGGQIEAKRGWLLMLFLVVVTATAGNIGQCFFKGPDFLGMSGGVYGLFGYIMVRQRIAPQEHLRVSSQSIFILLLWLVLGFAQVVTGIANFAHLFGLVMGILVAYVMPVNR